MSAHAQRLAKEFAEANDALIRVLEGLTPAQWCQRTRDEGELRPIGVIAHHVAWGHRHINQRVRAFADGSPVPPRRPDLFDERNARLARENPNPDQAATIAWLRREGEDITVMIAGLTDAQLQRRAREDPLAPELTTAEVIELRQIGHVRGHLASITSVPDEPTPA
jgi:DinB superfamily